MRATNIRRKIAGKLVKITHEELTQLCSNVVLWTAVKGFVTRAEVLNSGAIKIGWHMSSFRVNTAWIGHNARVGMYVDSPKGYKRTNVPTWDQRVEFNNIVNAQFDQMKLKAIIKSGCFTIREHESGAWNEGHWEAQTPIWMGYHGAIVDGLGRVISEILPEKEAREQCDSDRRETEHRQARNAARRVSKRPQLRLVTA